MREVTTPGVVAAAFKLAAQSGDEKQWDGARHGVLYPVVLAQFVGHSDPVELCEQLSSAFEQPKTRNGISLWWVPDTGGLVVRRIN